MQLLITTCELTSEQEISLLKSLRELSVADHRISGARNTRRVAVMYAVIERELKVSFRTFKYGLGPSLWWADLVAVNCLAGVVKAKLRFA
jgi:hypothetical protein